MVGRAWTRLQLTVLEFEVLADGADCIADACREHRQCAGLFQHQALARRGVRLDELHRVATGGGCQGLQIGDATGQILVGFEPLPFQLHGLGQRGECIALCPRLLGNGGIGSAGIAAQARNVHHYPQAISTAQHLIGRPHETACGVDDPTFAAKASDFIVEAFVDDVRPSVCRAIQALRIGSRQFQCRPVDLIALEVLRLRPGHRGTGLLCCDRTIRQQCPIQLTQAAERIARIGEHLSNPGIAMG